MKSAETSIADASNAVSLKAYEQLLKSFDTDGEPIMVDGVKMTSKGLHSNTYQTISGEVKIDRHVYQSSKGGSHYCPLEDKAHIILTSTPNFAEIVAGKLANSPAQVVVEDLMRSNKRKVVKNLVQRIGAEVARGIKALESEWTYDPSPTKEDVATVTIGLDGASVLMNTGEWRMAMVGTIGLYDKGGKRLHTGYCAASPEHGKEKFKARFSKEIQHISDLYPHATRIGIADGAADNWTFLERYTSKQTLDFYHATEYLADVAKCLFSTDALGKQWLENRCHQLKHIEDAATDILQEVVEYYDHILKGTEPRQMIFRKKAIPKAVQSDSDCYDDSAIQELENLLKIEDQSSDWVKSKRDPDILERRIEISSPFKSKVETKPLDDFMSYFKNNISKGRMDYAQNLSENVPIGSGITEAACKTLIKHRLCQSGMRWGNEGMDDILTLRALEKTKGKWESFWKKISDSGLPE